MSWKQKARDYAEASHGYQADADAWRIEASKEYAEKTALALHVAQLLEERADMKVLLWDVVTEGALAKTRAEAAEKRVETMLGQLENLYQALVLDEEGGGTVPTWVTGSVLDVLGSINE